MVKARPPKPKPKWQFGGFEELWGGCFFIGSYLLSDDLDRASRILDG